MPFKLLISTYVPARSREAAPAQIHDNFSLYKLGKAARGLAPLILTVFSLLHLRRQQVDVAVQQGARLVRLLQLVEGIHQVAAGQGGEGVGDAELAVSDLRGREPQGSTGQQAKQRKKLQICLFMFYVLFVR